MSKTTNGEMIGEAPTSNVVLHLRIMWFLKFQVSPILDEPMDFDDFMGLTIVVLSTEKYRLVRPLVIQDAMLV